MKPRLRNGLAAVLALLLLVGGFRVVRSLSFFQIRRVEVVGGRYLTAPAVAKVMAVPKGTSVFGAVDAYEKRVRGIPGVLEASVGRRIPGTLRVRITEAEPVALAERTGRLVLLDAAGRVLPFDPSIVPADLPLADTDSGVARLLARVRETDPQFFGRIERGMKVRTDVALDLPAGRVLFRNGATSDEIRDLLLVEQYLTRTGKRWKELDARFASRVFVRGMGA